VARNWFEIAQGRELHQGDLLVECPVYVPSLKHPVSDGDECDVVLRKYDLTILSQTCDLVEGQRADVRQVLLCVTETLEKLRNEPGHTLAKSDNRKILGRFGLNGFHPLPAFASDAIKRPFSVIQFSQTFSLPIDYVREYAVSSSGRLRLISPYRELLAQRFGYFFGRIAIDDRLDVPV
jgi:hypothetical protein